MLEQTVSRPTCEINGMTGGYTGEGFKTVIPAKASAKISFRLVSNMDPDKIRAAFRQHVRDRLPPDATVTFKQHGGSRAVFPGDPKSSRPRPGDAPARLGPIHPRSASDTWLPHVTTR